MTLTLTAEIEELVNERVKSGEYNSAAEVILSALHLLKAHKERVELLRDDINLGVEDIKSGRSTTLSSDEEVDQFISEIIAGGWEKHPQGEGNAHH